jgi:hypothetical protein
LRIIWCKGFTVRLDTSFYRPSATLNLAHYPLLGITRIVSMMRSATSVGVSCFVFRDLHHAPPDQKKPMMTPLSIWKASHGLNQSGDSPVEKLLFEPTGSPLRDLGVTLRAVPRRVIRDRRDSGRPGKLKAARARNCDEWLLSLGSPREQYSHGVATIDECCFSFGE